MVCENEMELIYKLPAEMTGEMEKENTAHK